MPIQVITNFEVNNPAPIDYRMGPYASVAEANTSIEELFRHVGLTVIITGSGEPVEYWYNPTTADGDLVLKTDTSVIDDLTTIVFQTNQLIEGTVWWTGVGLDYSASAHVYYIQGERYTAPVGLITLPPADPLLPRIDIIYADVNGQYGFITGSADVNPAKPVADYDTQIELTLVNVGAGATEPTTDLTNIYLENTEWSSSVFRPRANTTINFDSTVTPYAGSKCVRLTRTGTGAVQNASIQFKLTSSLQDFSGKILTFAISSSAVWNSNNSILLELYNESTRISSTPITFRRTSYGYNSANASWQVVSIPTTAFGLATQGSGNILRMSFSNNTWPTATGFSVALDQIQLQTDTTVANNVQYLTTASAANNVITFTKGDGSTFNVTVATGSGGTPAPSDTYIQYNSGSTFGASEYFRYIYTSQSLQQGADVIASGIYSHAEGSTAIASGSYSHAEGGTEGLPVIAIGQASHAEGAGTQAIGNYSHAEGRSSISSGSYSHAEGQQTTALGQYSHAEGAYTQAIGNWSHAEGSYTIASGSYQHVQGIANIPNSTEGAFIIGNGDPLGDRSNLIFAAANQVQISGSLYISGAAQSAGNNNVLTYNTTTGLVTYTASSAIGGGGGGTPAPSDTYIQYNSGSTFGADASFRFIYTSQSLQHGNTQAIGLVSHAEGDQTQAIGEASHAEGDGTVASGNFSHTEGQGTTASGIYSHAEGSGTQAIGVGSHAEGQFTIASGSYSHAEGNGTEALGDWSHAEGDNTRATGLYSHAEGTDTRTAVYALSASIESNKIVTMSAEYGNFTASLSNNGVTQLVVSGYPGLFYVSRSFYVNPNTIVELTQTSDNITLPNATIITLGGENAIIQLPEANILVAGNGSHAEGNVTYAVGNRSHAEGDGTLAIAAASHAEGQYTLASAGISHAEGRETQALGVASHAEGFQTFARSDNSHAEGEFTVSRGRGSHAEGGRFAESTTLPILNSRGYITTTARGNFSHAEGLSVAVGAWAHSEGVGNLAAGEGSHAEGFGTLSSGSYSHAEGSGSVAVGEASHTEGFNTITSFYGAYSASISAGIVTMSVAAGDVATEFAADTGSVLYAYDTAAKEAYMYPISRSYYSTPNTIVELFNTAVNISSAFVINPTAVNIPPNFGGNFTLPGNYAHAEGNGTIASGLYSHAEGGDTRAFGLYSHAEGSNSVAAGESSHAEGADTKAIGRFSHAEGAGVQSIGDYSHAEGANSTAYGTYSHAEGDNTETRGQGSHAEGTFTKTIGNYSHAEGEETRAIGLASHAEGNFTRAVGPVSHAEGYATAAGTNLAYSASISNGVVTLSGSYGNVPFDFPSNDTLLVINKNNLSIYYTYPISRSVYVNPNTRIELYDTTLNIPSALVANINYGSGIWGGDQTIAPEGVHAEGQFSVALGAFSHAEGNASVTVGESAHSEGSYTIALGQYSHAEGELTQAIGEGSHTEGLNTIASGSHSHAEGVQTITSASYQHVQGIANIGSAVTGAFIVGNGTVDNNGALLTRSNLIFAAGDTVEVTGSVKIKDILVLTPRTTTPVNPASGSIIVSGSGATIRPYFWDGSTWTQMFT